jgi:hypothetical protein
MYPMGREYMDIRKEGNKIIFPVFLLVMGHLYFPAIFRI